MAANEVKQPTDVAEAGGTGNGHTEAMRTPKLRGLGWGEDPWAKLEAEPQDVESLIEAKFGDEARPWMPTDIVGLLVGAPGVGKGWLSLRLALSVAGGVPFHKSEWGSLEPKHGPAKVVIVTAEDTTEQIKERLRRIAREVFQRKGTGEVDPQHTETLRAIDANLRIVDLRELGKEGFAPSLLSTNEDGGVVASGVAKTLEGLVSNHVGNEPGLVIVDTLARACVGFDVEGNADASTAAVQVLETLKAGAPKRTVLAVHHSKKSGDKPPSSRQALAESARGSSGILGAVRWMVNLLEHDVIGEAEAKAKKGEEWEPPSTLDRALERHGHSLAELRGEDGQFRARPWMRLFVSKTNHTADHPPTWWTRNAKAGGVVEPEDKQLAALRREMRAEAGPATPPPSDFWRQVEAHFG